MIRTLPLVLLVGCVPRFETVGCYSAAECPVGFSCEARECVAPPVIDAGVPDAMVVDAGPPAPDATPALLSGDGVASLGPTLAVVGDIDGDGFADVAVGTTRATPSGCSTRCGRVQLFGGSAAGLAPEGVAAIDGPDVADARFGQRLAGLGDVNGDGVADFAVSTREGPVYVFHGSADGWVGGGAARLAAGQLPPVSAALNHGIWLGGGDLDGDGFDDLVALAVPWTTRRAACGEGLVDVRGASAVTWVAYGAPSGIGERPPARFDWQPPAADLCACRPVERRNCAFGRTGALGDVDGDGRAEVLLTDHGAAAGRGRIRVLLDPARVTLTEGVCDGSVLAPALAGGDAVLAAVGDLDGDGYGDVIALERRVTDACAMTDRLLLLAGGPDGLAAPRIFGVAPKDEQGPVQIDAIAVQGDPAERIFALSHDAEGPDRIWVMRPAEPEAWELLFATGPGERLTGTMAPYQATAYAPVQLLVVVRPADADDERWRIVAIQPP